MLMSFKKEARTQLSVCSWPWCAEQKKKVSDNYNGRACNKSCSKSCSNTQRYASFGFMINITMGRVHYEEGSLPAMAYES